MSWYKCHCGHMHELNEFKESHRAMKKVIEEEGENAVITIMDTGARYIVPRIYVVIHGIKGKDIPTLGFKEVTK